MAGDADGGDGEQRAEHVGQSVEGVQRGDPDDDEDRAQQDRQHDPEDEHLVAVLGPHAKHREQHGEDEQVVERERLFDQEAGHVLAGRLTVLQRGDHARERQAQDGPADRPAECLARTRRVC